MSLLARLPILEWCHRVAAGKHEDLAWVDATVEVQREPYSVVEAPDGVCFQHMPYAGFQPPSMLEAQAEAQARGVPTLQEGLLLLFARVEWLIAARERAWTPLTPTPAGLVALVEAYGVERAVHGDDPEVLARLVAMLPSWYPSRGTVPSARRIVATAERGALPELLSLAEHGPAPAALSGELFACRSTEFWEARHTEGAQVELRITEGFLLFQSDTPGVLLRREDLAVAWRPAAPPSLLFLRLLPPWSLIRPFLASEPA